MLNQHLEARLDYLLTRIREKNMAAPELQIQARVRRIEEALEFVGEKALYAEDQETLKKILRGEKVEKEDDAT